MIRRFLRTTTTAALLTASLTLAPAAPPPAGPQAPDPHVLLQQAAVAKTPQEAAVLTYNAGCAAGQQGHWNLARQAYERFMTMAAPAQLAQDGTFNYGVSLAQSGQREQAIEIFKALLRDHPADEEARANLEWLLLQEPPPDPPPPPQDQPTPPAPSPSPSPAGGPSTSRPYTPEEARNMLQRMPPPRLAPPAAPENPPRNLRPY